VRKLFETHRQVFACLLIFSFIVWVNGSAFPGFAQGQTPDAQAQKSGEPGQDFPAVKSDTLKAIDPETKSQVVEKAEGEKPKVRKKRFPWFGVILSLAIAGGLVYYFVILKTSLQVDTTPAGAKVYLDGSDTQKVSPCQLKTSIGSHTVKVVLDGYADVERELVIRNGKNSIAIPLAAATYTLTAPAAGVNVQRETTCLIRWDSSAMAAFRSSPASNKVLGVTNVDLELYQEGTKVRDIARGVPNSGSYNWDVPAATPEGSNFKIMVSCPGVPESSGFGPPFNLMGFKEDFADNVADFWLPDHAASWKVAGGYYTATKTTERLGVGIYDFFYPETSYTVESKMRWSEFSGANTGAPLFIMLGVSTSFAGNAGYMMGYSMDGSIGIYLIGNYNFLDPPSDPPTIIYSGSSSAVIPGLNNWNTVKIVRSGAHYALYINNTLIYSFTDSTYNPTHVMIGFGGAGVKTTCDFDYVYMTVNH
jgi:hypothetical protein